MNEEPVKYTMSNTPIRDLLQAWNNRVKPLKATEPTPEQVFIAELLRQQGVEADPCSIYRIEVEDPAGITINPNETATLEVSFQYEPPRHLQATDPGAGGPS